MKHSGCEAFQPSHPKLPHPVAYRRAAPVSPGEPNTTLLSASSVCSIVQEVKNIFCVHRLGAGMDLRAQQAARLDFSEAPDGDAEEGPDSDSGRDRSPWQQVVRGDPPPHPHTICIATEWHQDSARLVVGLGAWGSSGFG